MYLHVLRAVGIAMAAAISAPAFGAPTPGTYERVPKSTRESGRLVVSGISDRQATVNLEVLFNPYPSDGRFSYGVDNGLSRNGVLEREVVETHGNVALFRAPKEDDPPCSLVFVFQRAAVEITQFGECSWFGVGVNATGRYILQAKQGAAR
jgi:hypothetical protein